VPGLNLQRSECREDGVRQRAETRASVVREQAKPLAGPQAARGNHCWLEEPMLVAKARPASARFVSWLKI